jgi:hypothetical protein
MTTSVPSAGTSPFSHLARNPSAAIAGRASDDDKKKDEEEAAAKKKAEEDKKKDEEEAAAKKKAEDDKKKEEKAEDDKKKEDAKKKGKADDGDDDSDRDDDENPEARAARARERGRIRAIVTSEAGKLNPVGAMHIATGTSMSRRQAIEMVHAMGAPAASEPPRPTDPLRDRMAGVKTPDVGAGDTQQPANAGTAQATAAAIVAAGKKRRGEV